MENIENTGVNEPVAAEQDVPAVNEPAVEENSAETPTGVEGNPVGQPKFALSCILRHERESIDKVKLNKPARDVRSRWEQLVSGWDRTPLRPVSAEFSSGQCRYVHLRPYLNNEVKISTVAIKLNQRHP